MRTLLLLASLAVTAPLACATPPPPPSPPVVPTAAKPLRHCRMALEIRPGTAGAAASAKPVQDCEPVAPPVAAEAEPPEDDEAPLGTPVLP